jgi:CRP-like cAMP-binding protein
MSDKIDTLKQMELFSELSDGELSQVADIIDTRTYANDETIMHMDEIGINMFIIKSGGVNIHYQKDDDEGFMLRHLGKGKHFGEMSLFDNKPRSALVKAVGDTELFVLEKDKLFTFLKGPADKQTVIKMMMAITYELCARLRFTSNDLYISMGVGSRELTQDEIDKLTQELKSVHNDAVAERKRNF